MFFSHVLILPDNRNNFLHVTRFIHIKFTMLKRIYTINLRNYFNRPYRIGRFSRYRGISPMDLVLYLLPLFFLMIILPPIERVEPVASSIDMVEIVTDPDIRITVYNPEKSVIEEFELEDYVTGVVAAEMPASFHEEALKAQAVAARTFALSRMHGLYGSTENHFGAHVCTNYKHCQAWISKERYLSAYGDEEAYEKIKRAVNDTKNVVMTYDGILINPLYHSNSGGVTEDVEAVWAVSGQVPYLKSVYSVDESNYNQYETMVVFTWEDIKNRLLTKYSQAEVQSGFNKEIEIMSYSASGRVQTIRIGNIEMTGPEFRELLDLRSTNLEISFPDSETVEIVTKGFGHGVGMSQCGADALGNSGYNFKEILEYYYTGIRVEEIKQ